MDHNGQCLRRCLGPVTALLKTVPAGTFEVTIHQHMPMFHMEHCVFCAFLSKGKDYRDCGRPCVRHAVVLRDRVGQDHPLRADVGCRNTLYNARAQTAAEYVPELIRLGVLRFRIEFVDESPATARQLIRQYQALLRGDQTGERIWKDFRLKPQLGVTRGTLKPYGKETHIP